MAGLTPTTSTAHWKNEWVIFFSHVVSCTGLIPRNDCRLGRETYDGWIDDRKMEGLMDTWKDEGLPNLISPRYAPPGSLLSYALLILHSHCQAQSSGAVSLRCLNPLTSPTVRSLWLMHGK